jgi:hypothetical protein
MIALVLIGALLGAALFALLVLLMPPRTSPLVALGRFDARTAGASFEGGQGRAGPPPAALQERVGQWLSGQLARRGVAFTRLRQDVALAGRDPEAVLGSKLLWGTGGLLFGLLVCTVGARLLGVPLPSGAPVLAGLAGAVAFFLAPDIELRRRAAQRRAEFRAQLAVYLDLVALQMAASAAPAEALPAAARIGGAWPMLLLRDTLHPAGLAGRDQWAALAELGERIGIPELRELGMVVRLVVHDGARVRQTLLDRAASLRASELADAEGKAGERKQTMQLGQILLGFALIAFLMYPAVASLGAAV